MKSRKDPFKLDPGEYPFLDALLFQCVAAAAYLHWEGDGGGFFIEAEQPPLDGFEQATLVTGRGKRVPGFAAQMVMFYPIASNTIWTIGPPGNRTRVDGYREGAKSRTQVLAMLQNGQWAIITARGLASQNLGNTFRDHRYQTMRAQSHPFFMAMFGAVGEAEPMGSAVVTPFNFVTLEEYCPEELGWSIRERWDEVQAWLDNGSVDNNDLDDREQPQEAAQEQQPSSDSPDNLPNDGNGNIPAPHSPSDWTTFWSETVPALDLTHKAAQAAVQDSGEDAVKAYEFLTNGGGDSND